MNNALMKPEVEVYGLNEDVKVIRTTRALKLGKLIESLEAISSSKHWQTIVAEVFEPELEKLRRELINEEDTVKVFRLQGKIAWAEKKIDMPKLITQFKTELSGIRKNLHGKEEG